MRYLNFAIRYHAADRGQALVEFGFMRIVLLNSVAVACSGNIVFRSSRAISYLGIYAIQRSFKAGVFAISSSIIDIALNCAIATESDGTAIAVSIAFTGNY